MNKNIAIVAVILVIAAIGGYFVITSEDSDWTAPWVTTTQGLTGTWFVEPYLTYADGSTENINGGLQALWMKHDDIQVTTITYVLKAQATRDVNQGSFETCELDVDDLKINAMLSYDFGTFKSSDFWMDLSGIVTLPFAAGSSTTDVVTVATYIIPVDIDGSSVTLGVTNMGPIPTLPCSTMNQMTTGDVIGTHQLIYSVEGTSLFRGTSSDFGDSDWANAGVPASVMHFVEIGSYEVSMSWDKEIVYNP